MPRRFDIFYTVKGKECNLVGTIDPPDPSVGIFGVGVEDMTVTDLETGQALQLTDEEYIALCEDEKLLEKVSDVYHDDPDAP